MRVSVPRPHTAARQFPFPAGAGPVGIGNDCPVGESEDPAEVTILLVAQSQLRGFPGTAQKKMGDVPHRRSGSAPTAAPRLGGVLGAKFGEPANRLLLLGR